jgi:hypothetical protein
VCFSPIANPKPSKTKNVPESCNCHLAMHCTKVQYSFRRSRQLAELHFSSQEVTKRFYNLLAVHCPRGGIARYSFRRKNLAASG